MLNSQAQSHVCSKYVDICSPNTLVTLLFAFTPFSMLNSPQLDSVALLVVFERYLENTSVVSQPVNYRWVYD